MASQRLMSIARAAGCAMAPTEEYLDGPSHVMPRPQSDFATIEVNSAAGTDIAVRWTDVSTTVRLRELVGNLWFGRPTTA